MNLLSLSRVLVIRTIKTQFRQIQRVKKSFIYQQRPKKAYLDAQGYEIKQYFRDLYFVFPSIYLQSLNEYGIIDVFIDMRQKSDLTLGRYVPTVT